MLAAARVDGSQRPLRARRPGVHVVRSGDSLWRIAKRNRMDVATLARLNGMGPGDTLRAGQKLVLQHARAGIGQASLGILRQLARRSRYKVRSGDTLSRIAQVFGVTVSDLRQLERHQQRTRRCVRARSSRSTFAAADFVPGEARLAECRPRSNSEGIHMGFLSGKRALIVGVASDRSIAWGIAQAMHREGAELAFSYVNEKFKERVQPLAESLRLESSPCQLDVTSDAEIDCRVRAPSSRPGDRSTSWCTRSPSRRARR